MIISWASIYAIVAIILIDSMTKHLTTISLDEETKDRLLTYGKMGDSFQDVLVRLMDSYDNHKEYEDDE